MNPMNRNLMNLTLAAVLSTLAGTALAEPAAKTAPISLKDYDANGDGMVSEDEFRALGGSDLAFRKADANGDNMLSGEEFAKASARASASEGRS